MSPKMPVVTGVELVRVLKQVGFVERRQKGSHLHMFRAADHRRVTIPIHSGRSIPIGTLKAILKDAGLNNELLRELLG